MLDVSGHLSRRWELYRILSEPVRLRLLALAGEEELAIGELAELLGESQPNVSRHAAPLKQAALLTFRREGTRTLVRLAEDASNDLVIADALASGRALCIKDGSFGRIGDVIRARDATSREFFATTSAKKDDLLHPPHELASYLAAFAPLLPHRALAVDAGTGDGGLLDVLAPVFERVIAIDRSDAQLAVAQQRIDLRGFTNTHLVRAELDDAELRKLVKSSGGADLVFAVRVLHHAPRPADVVAHLAELCRAPSPKKNEPGGAVVVIDYARHDDETMRGQADLWLGFEAVELRRFARRAGLEPKHVGPIAAPGIGNGPDGHLPWQVMIAERTSDARPSRAASKS